MARKMIDYERVARERDKNLRHGALVMVKPEFERLAKKTPTGTVLVVLGDKFDMLNCVPVGGNAADPLSYVRTPATWVRVIDPAGVVLAAESDPEKRYLSYRGPS